MVVKDGGGNGSGICLKRFSPETFTNSGRVLFALVESLHFQIDKKKTKYRPNHSSCTARRPARSKTSRSPSFVILFVDILEGIRRRGISHLRPPLAYPTTTREWISLFTSLHCQMYKTGIP